MNKSRDSFSGERGREQKICMSAKLVKVCNSFSGIARGTVKMRVRNYHLSSLTRPSVAVTSGTLTSEYYRQPIVTEGKDKLC